VVDRPSGLWCSATGVPGLGLVDHFAVHGQHVAGVDLHGRAVDSARPFAATRPSAI
jgi:hypothetical protein